MNGILYRHFISKHLLTKNAWLKVKNKFGIYVWQTCLLYVMKIMGTI